MISLNEFIKTKKIRSILVNFEVNEKIDISQLTNIIENCYLNEYNDRTINLVIENPKNNIKYVIWKSGKIRAMGINKIIDLKNCSKDFISFMKKNQIDLAIKKEPVIKNIVVTIDIQKFLNLSSIYLEINNERSSFEPEIFPGIVFKKELNENVTFLIFNSGKIVMVGMKSIDSIDKMIKYIYRII